MPNTTALYRDKARLQAALREVPPAPGVYRFYDVSGALVYIGKSICLRDRVRSYFTGRATTKKLRRMRQEINSLDWQETGSELEALLLESRLVKRHQPRFNVLLRAFVPLPYVRVDLRDPYPRLEVTRAPERDGASYFGPFYNHGAVEEATSRLSDALRLRDCAVPGEKLASQKPCYRHEFGTCSAPCLGLVEPEEYRRSVENACAVFEGREQSALQMLQRRMEQAAERLQFEIAARLRDALRHIRSVCGRQAALHSAVRDLSLVAACPSRTADRLCLFVFRSGRLVLQDEAPFGELRAAASRKAWARRLVSAEAPEKGTPDVRIDPSLLDEIQIVTGWMRQKTREGAYWQFPPGVTNTALAAQLAAWLAEQAEVSRTQLAA
jgi:excinuclease UvrABC nuclease subunit